MKFAPLEGWRHVKVTDRHTAVDYAHVLKDLADIHFAHAKTIVLVQDNLSIHSKASLYEAFPAVEARRLVERFEWHSWLDLAESELGVLTSQCLDRRIPDKQTLIEEIAAWEEDRNANHTKADWQFTTKNARIKHKPGMGNALGAGVGPHPLFAFLLPRVLTRQHLPQIGNIGFSLARGQSSASDLFSFGEAALQADYQREILCHLRVSARLGQRLAQHEFGSFQLLF
jgi:hypothetical protein